MTSSGVKVTDSLRVTYENFKMKKGTTKYRYLILKMSDDKSEIILEREEPAKAGSDPREDFESFVEALPRDEARFILYDFHATDINNAKQSRIVMITYVPDASTMKDKMLFASSKEALKKALELNGKDYSVHDIAELTYELAAENAGIKILKTSK
uniref:Cofilin (Trinotate prediction) n=1 Tax=Henneguya salminicola TaxID=69463 RepID=A0A6G3MJ34_HENSL